MQRLRALGVFLLLLPTSCQTSSLAECNLMCGPHETCGFDSGEGPRCECVAGYDGDPCVWTGALEGPGFGTDDAWSETNGATILPLRNPPIDRGIASFESRTTCTAGAVSQVVEMPSYEDAEPFVVEVHFRTSDAQASVGVGRAFRRLRGKSAFPDWSTDSFCLGEAGYGGAVKFQIAATERVDSCFSAPTGIIEVDRFEIKVAEEGKCPAPGQTLNGDANVDEEGWFFDVEQRGVGLAGASLEPGVGESNSSGARLYKAAGSQNRAAMYTQLSVPLPSTLPSPALRFWWKATSAWWYYVDLGTYPGPRSVVSPFDTLKSDGDAHASTYCLPPWTQGNLVDLSFGYLEGPDDEEGELVVDGVELISDTRCGSSTDLLDPSFDSAPYRWPGASIAREEEPRSEVRLVNDSVRAHPPGAGLLELRYASNRARLEAQTSVWVPPSQENRGPQLVFHSNVPAEPGLSVFWALGDVLTSVEPECNDGGCPSLPLRQELPAGLGWQRNTVCLPAAWAERWYRFRVAIRPSDEPFEAFDPARAVLLDDFEVTTDEACAPP